MKGKNIEQAAKEIDSYLKESAGSADDGILKVDKKLVEQMKRRDNAKLDGDLRENSEYVAACEEIGQLEAQKARLYNKRMVYNNFVAESTSSRIINMGSTVHVVEEKEKIDAIVRIVPKELSEPQRGIISVTSPLGKALLEKTEGGVCVVKGRTHNLTYKIVEVL